MVKIKVVFNLFILHFNSAFFLSIFIFLEVSLSIRSIRILIEHVYIVYTRLNPASSVSVPPTPTVLVTACVSTARVPATPGGLVRLATWKYARTIVRSILNRASAIQRAIDANATVNTEVKRRREKEYNIARNNYCKSNYINN